MSLKTCDTRRKQALTKVTGPSLRQCPLAPTRQKRRPRLCGLRATMEDGCEDPKRERAGARRRAEHRLDPRTTRRGSWRRPSTACGSYRGTGRCAGLAAQECCCAEAIGFALVTNRYLRMRSFWGNSAPSVLFLDEHEIQNVPVEHDDVVCPEDQITEDHFNVSNDDSVIF